MEKISSDCHEHHQHLMQLLSLPLSWGQEKRKHWYFQQNIFTFTELWCVLAVVDRHRERKSKNLIPARLGIYSIFVFGFHQICEQFAYNALRTKVSGQMDTLFQSLSSIPGKKNHEISSGWPWLHNTIPDNRHQYWHILLSLLPSPHSVRMSCGQA